jgi:hypothetical protein
MVANVMAIGRTGGQGCLAKGLFLRHKMRRFATTGVDDPFDLLNRQASIEHLLFQDGEMFAFLRFPPVAGKRVDDRRDDPTSEDQQKQEVRHCHEFFEYARTRWLNHLLGEKDHSTVLAADPRPEDGADADVILMPFVRLPSILGSESTIFCTE